MISRLQILQIMMEKNFTYLTIDTTVNSIVMHHNPHWAASILLDFLRQPEVSEKDFWRFLQDNVIVDTILNDSCECPP